jgi:hypothetical protein
MANHKWVKRGILRLDKSGAPEYIKQGEDMPDDYPADRLKMFLDKGWVMREADYKASLNTPTAKAELAAIAAREANKDAVQKTTKRAPKKQRA